MDSPRSESLDGSEDEFEGLLNDHLDTRDRYRAHQRYPSSSRSSSPPRKLSYRELQQQQTVTRRVEAGLADGAPANPTRNTRPPPPPPATKKKKLKADSDDVLYYEPRLPGEDGDVESGRGEASERIEPEPETSWSLADLAAAGRAVPGSRQEREWVLSEKQHARKALAAASVAATRARGAHAARAAAAAAGGSVEWVS